MPYLTTVQNFREDLSQELLCGPDLTYQVVGALTHFQQEQVAFMRDM